MKHLLLAVSLSFLCSMYHSAEVEAADKIEHIEVRYRQAYRGDVPVAKIPQSIETLERAIVEDGNITRFRDILLFSPSIALQNDGGNLWDSFSIRGFPGNENVPTGYLVNGFASGRGFGGHRDVSNIDYVEVLKGPGSALYGRSDPGGVINVVTRKPQFAPEGYLQVTAGSDDRYRLEGDYTTGINKSLAMRINGAWEDYGSFRDFVTSDKRVINPSISWRATPDITVMYAMEYMQHEQLFDRGIVVLEGDTPTIPRERYLGEPNDNPTRIISQGHQLTYEHHFDDDWFVTGGINFRHSTLDGYSSDAELSVSRQQVFKDGQTLTRQRRRRDYDADDLSARLEFNGHANTLGLTHHLLTGVDAYQYDLYTLLARVRPEPGDYALNIHEPVYGAAPPVPQTLYVNDEQQHGFGIYIQDQIELHDQWHLLLGLRFDQYSQQTVERISGTKSDQRDSRSSPRIALSYFPFDDLTLYASYSEGFVPISGTDYQGRGFDPEESDSVEIGMKYTGRYVDVTAAVFDATKTNILTSDPVHQGYPATLGAATSQGAEILINTVIADDTQIRLAYAYTDSQTKNAITNLDWGVTVPAGSDLVNIPQHSVSARIKHDLHYLGVDAQVGATARWIDERLGDSVTLSYRLPAYSVFNAFYNHQITPNTQLQFNVDNIFDDYYLSNAYSALWTTPGAPRQYSASLTYAF